MGISRCLDAGQYIRIFCIHDTDLRNFLVIVTVLEVGVSARTGFEKIFRIGDLYAVCAANGNGFDIFRSQDATQTGARA